MALRGGSAGVLLVDVYNVIQTTGVLPPELAGPEVEDLAYMIGRSRFARSEPVLVCDGVRPRRGRGRRAAGGKRGGAGSVLFAGPGREADEVIERLIDGYRGPRRGLIVVSTDRRLQRAARLKRARWFGSGPFLEILAEDLQRPSTAGEPRAATRPRGRGEEWPDTVGGWLGEFGVDDPHELVKDAHAHADEAHREMEERGHEAEPAAPGGLNTSEDPDPEASEGRDAREDASDPWRFEGTWPEDRRPIDPELLRLINELGESVPIEDLDMSRWLR